MVWNLSLAAAGHTDIQRYYSTFTVVGSTAAVDAQDNTHTTYTSSDKGVPIYWLNGNNVADDYEDFYDGGWDDQANSKTEAGTSTSATTIWTGCDEDGAEAIHIGGTASRALGTFSVAFGDLDHATLGPVGHPNNIGGNALSKPFYGLSAVFRVVQGPPTVVPADWSLIPSGLVAGQEFRLLFLSSTKRSIRSTNISDYNTFVQNRAAAGHTDIQDYSDTFRVLGSTGAKAARDNTGTTYTSSDKGVRIYWLNGDKAADQYEDFYDGSWDQQADAWNESGVEYDLSARRFVATGSSKNGTTDQSNPLGASSGEVQLGCLYETSAINGPVSCNFTTENISADNNQQLYGLSGVFQVTTNNATGKPVITGTPEVRQTLTADISGIMDEDGLPFLVQFSYQWIRSDGTTDSDISGATDSTYKVKAADQGKTIKVKVTFTDGGGTEETLTSDATTAVAADTTGPVVEEVICFDSLCNLVFDELLDENLNNVPLTIAFAITADGVAITVGIAFPLIDGRFRLSSLAPQIRQGQTVKVKYTDPTSGDDTKAIQDAAGNDAADFTTGEDGVPAVTNNSTLAPVAPSAPTGLTATPNGATQIDLAWTAPADNGGSVIKGYQIEYSDDGGTSWGVLVPDTQSTDTMYPDTALSGGETRHYRVSAINSIGTGAASNSPPTGKPAITGTPEVNQTLTDDSNISGATDSTYKLEAADQGKAIKVRVTFTDEGGTEETLTSDATTAVAADTTGPVVEQVICDDGACGLFFDDLIDGNVPPTNAFAITADGAAITVGGVFPLSDGQIRLTLLAPQIYQGQTVKIVYTDPTGGDDTRAIQDAAGNDAADFTTGEGDVPAVTNNSTVEPSTVTLVSNADRTIEGAISRTIQAQSFVTGPSTGGYMLSTIQIQLGDDSALPGVTDLIAAIKADDGSGEPGALVANLANPASLTNDALNTFTAPTGTVLAPDTTYWVVVNEERSDTDRVNLRVTAQDEEDEAFPGWSIGNNHLSKVSESGSWNHSATVSNLIVVNGSVIVGTADTTGPVVEEVICFDSFCNLVFDQLLDDNVDHVPSTNAFAVTVDGAAITVGGVFRISGNQIKLVSLAPQIYQGQSVTVTYTDPTGGNDEAAIQDEAGNDAASFTAGEDDVPAVTNNSTVAPPPLVSNIGQTAATGAANVSTTQSSAQGFTTGTNSGGYTLDSVELAVTPFDGTASDITVSIYSESSGDPGTLVHTLTTPGSLSDPVTTFTAPSGATLAASTTYYVVASTTSTLFLLSRTEATVEDTGGASGWSIADDRRFSRNLVTWTTATVPIRMRINGEAATSATSTDATLSSLVLNDGTNNLTLTPNFATGTTSYTASVANAVSQITVTPTKSDSDASVEYLDGNDAAITDADSVTTGQQVALEVGVNTIKVQVTAEDDATTETYTVVVTRQAQTQTGIWSATVTPGALSSLVGWWDRDPDIGAITDKDFTYDGVTYSVKHIRVGSAGGLQLSVDQAFTATAMANLVLDVDGSLFPLSDSTGTDDAIRNWDSAGLSWTVGTDVALKMLEQPSTTPGAPSNVQASGNAELGVTWDVPNNGGSAITGYTVQWKSGAESYSTTRQATVTTTTHTIPTLTNDTTYTVRVKATNANGDSGWAETTGTPASGPGVASVTVDQATITKTGADVTVTVANLQNDPHVVFLRYRVAGGAWPSVANHSWSTGGTAITFTLTGLTGNTDYDVAASLDSTFASGVKTAAFTTSPTKPGKTRSVTIGILNGQIVIGWQAPDSDGGSAITGYTVQWKSGSQSFGDPSREHGAVEVGQPELRRSLAGTHLRDFVGGLHRHRADQRHRVHGAGDRGERRRRRPAVR